MVNAQLKYNLLQSMNEKRVIIQGYDNEEQLLAKMYHG